jgi:Family of unknown function (DUF6496)
MHAFKEEKLKSGATSKNKVTKPKQAIAIVLSQARKKGARAPKKRVESPRFTAIVSESFAA